MISNFSPLLFRSLGAALLLALLATAHATQDATPEPRPVGEALGADPRIRHILYHEDAVVRLKVGPYPTLVELAPGEAILDVACDGKQPNPKTWDIVWRAGQDYLFVEPHAGARPAGMTVKTARHSYVFDLVPDLALSLFDPARTAKLVVELPEDADALGQRVTAAELQQRERGYRPLRRNDRYSLEVVHELEDVRPRDVFDDGRFTYMRFPNNLAIPAIYRSVPGTKSERLVNSHMEGDFVVLEGLARLWNLRIGGTVLGVFNENYDAQGMPPAGGTTVPGVTRELAPEPARSKK